MFMVLKSNLSLFNLNDKMIVKPFSLSLSLTNTPIVWSLGCGLIHALSFFSRFLRSGPTYKKVVFREYEKGFQRAKTHPSWLGLLGPTLRAEEGETIVVTFRNMATGPYSIHPHGVAYGKQSEGAHYFDNTSQKEKEDDVVQPNSENIYYWGVTPDVSPQPNDPTCLTYTYISHKNVVEDYNTGLIGTLLVCKPGKYKNMCFHLCLMGAAPPVILPCHYFESKFKPNSHASDNHVKYTINGFTKGSLPDVTLCAHASVSLHLVGMSSNPEVFSVHINGQVLQQTGHKMSSVGLISGSAATASMVAFHTGRWLLSSHTIKHMEVGMHGFVNVKKCDGFEFPQRRMTIAQKQQMRKWTYYIAAEEIIWDYAPNMPKHIDEQSPTRIGGKYKKAVYVLYKNESFTEKLENKQRRNELGILGPVIRAQIRDVIKVRPFLNKASKPYSIYPHGLTIEKSQEGYSYPAGSNQSHSVKPGETHTYEWNVVEEDKPLDSDSRCLTRIYHSAVDTPRDIASGLIGPMLICKSQSLNVRNVQLKADKEQHSMFAVFDENKSWYLDDNIRQYSDGSKVKKAEPGFYKSNVMHTINGYAFENGTPLGFCNGEVVTWHVSSIGAQDCIQTATFYGHPFELNERTEDFLSLYPMTGETITMNMDNIGLDEQDVKADEYEYVSFKDPYSSHEDIKNLNLDKTNKIFFKYSDKNVNTYFIAAEEVEWDYAGYGQNRETKFTKVVFRSYMDSTFSTPEIHGEIHEHLGILGPVIKAEVQQTIMVVFKNNAKRPYSLHPNGDGSKYWYKYDNEERDIHSGLIGPLLVCQVGTLDSELPDMREFILLFMTFDESQSWYYEKNHEIMQRKNRRKVMDPNFKENLKFHSINGIVYNLKGLRMYTNQLVCWHLINMGSPHDFQSVHFHGQTFLHKKTTSYRRAIYPLLPGSFATLEMYPSKPGLWQLETEVGFNQQKGMQTLFLVLDNGISKIDRILYNTEILLCYIILYIIQYCFYVSSKTATVQWV
uniref:Plastocyanin-like domain-containing protein n=1 Tax=Mola mola TaxID=94237 RepID=A0A3Q4ACB9_MOLML